MGTSGDDKRAASGLVASIAMFLLTASLTVLGALAAYFTFVLDHRSASYGFWIAAGLGTISLLISSIMGAAALYYMAIEGAKGNWIISTPNHAFNVQAVLSLMGILLALASVFFTTARVEDVPLAQQVSMLQSQLDVVRNQMASMQAPGGGLSPCKASLNAHKHDSKR